jgi:hypothetical protein
VVLDADVRRGDHHRALLGDERDVADQGLVEDRVDHGALVRATLRLAADLRAVGDGQRCSHAAKVALEWSRKQVHD